MPDSSAAESVAPASPLPPPQATAGDDAASVDAETYGYCNACGEEMWDGDECCEEGEWVPDDLNWEPSGADARAFANAYGYSVVESRSYLQRNGPDARTSRIAPTTGDRT